MTFFVPEKYSGLFDEVDERFRLLLEKGVVSGISEVHFNKWVKNFVSDEDRYLCAQVLSNLTFRSEDMVRSALKHILMCILPCELRKGGIDCGGVDDFLLDLEQGANQLPIRFVQTTDAKERVGKSGAALIRELHRLGGVANSLLCDISKIDKLPRNVRGLVFIDDMVGTGKQFCDFAKHAGLEELSKTKQLIYCPLAAYHTGLQALEKDCPWLRVFPVEQFGEGHRFYREDAAGLWALDGANSIGDVKQKVDEISSGGQLPRSEFSLDLVIGFHDSTPNNTIPLLWAKSARWNPLLVR